MIQPLLGLLREVYIGAEGNHTFVIDNAPGNGILSSIKSLSAKDASTPTHHGGTTVAAHTHHLKWSLDYAMEFFKGKMPQWNWDDSWTVFNVNEKEWSRLQDELKENFDKIEAAIKEVKDWSNGNFLKGTLALLPHASYHLGAIKQLILAVKHTEKTMVGLQ